MADLRDTVVRWLNSGVDPDAPDDATKHIVLANQLALFFTVVTAAIAAGPAMSRWSPVVRVGTAAMALGLPFVLVLNARRRHVAAACWMLAVVGGLDILTGRHLPSQTNHVMFLVPICVVAPFLFPPSQRRLALVVTGVLALGFAAVVAWDTLAPPVVDADDSFVRTIGYTNRLAVVGLSVAIALYATRQTHRVEAALSDARAQSDRLLRNMLPARIAERLKRDPGVIADRYDEASVVFADLVGFTQLSRTIPPEQLVALLDELFSEFDVSCDELGLEKIKTIGDAYMAVAGVPTPRPDHAIVAVKLALAMKRSVAAVAARSGHALEVRVGIHSGPVVAGVIGRRKYAYDLWGETVNVASRLESHGVVGEIQISDATKALLDDGDFTLTERPDVELKGAGTLTTYLVS